MIILIITIAFSLLFVLYMAWVYINSCVFTFKKFVNDETEINKVPMKQFFHFD